MNPTLTLKITYIHTCFSLNKFQIVYGFDFVCNLQRFAPHVDLAWDFLVIVNL